MLGRSLLAVGLVALGAAGAVLYQQVLAPDTVQTSQRGGGRPGGPPGRGGFGRGGFGPQPLLVDTAKVQRADVAEELEIVGNLVGAASIEVAPKVNGRLSEVRVRIGDRVGRGQAVARVEDDELRQQVSQAEAAYAVAQATVRQREADLTLARTNRERTRSLFDRELLSRQELDDAEAQFQASTAQLDLARAQFDEASARLEELRINLENTVMLSPVNGFVGRRYLDPGAFVTQASAVVSIVDIRLVRLVANLVERDLRLRRGGRHGPDRGGRLSRRVVRPVRSPASRRCSTRPPGRPRSRSRSPTPTSVSSPACMPAMHLGIGSKADALVVPREAIVLRRNNARGVFVTDPTAERPTARFVTLAVGFEDDRHVEALDGVAEGDVLVTTGAAGAAARRPGARGRSESERRPVRSRTTGSVPGHRADADPAARNDRRGTDMSLPSLAVRRPVTMSMISVVVILLGAVALVRLPVDLMPDVTFPSLTVRVTYQDVGPLEMEELVTRPIEQTVAAIAGLQEITSTSSEGQSTVRLNFDWGTDLNEAADDLRSRLDRTRAMLPEDAEPPVVFKFDAASMPIMFMGLEGDLDAVELREMAENDLGPRLERVPGVATVSVRGGLRRQILVELAKDKITALDLAVDEVINLLSSENQNVPIGQLDDGDMTYLLRSPGQFTSLDDIRNIVVLTRNGVPIFMRDIAEVTDGTEDREDLVRINGRQAVQIAVSKQSGRNTVAVARGVRAEIERINTEMPAIQLSTRMDSAIFVERSIAAVRNVVLWGAVLVVGVLFAFLRNVRTTLIICTAIPISIIGTFAGIYFAGFTLNTLTFGGLALGVGMIVDASIVVLENTFRHMEGGKDRKTASVDGAEEVSGAIIASTLTQVAVFLPLLFLTGIASIMFGQLAVVVMIALGMSLFVAVTLVPVMTSKLLRLPPPEEERTGFVGRVMTTSEHALARLDDFYRRTIHVALAASAVGARARRVPSSWWRSCWCRRSGVELTPEVDEGEVRVYAELPVGTRFERTEQVMLQLEEMALAEIPEAVNITTQVGGGGGGPVRRRAQSHRGGLTVTLTEKTERTRSSNDIAMALRRTLERAARRHRAGPRLGRQPHDDPHDVERQRRGRAAGARDPRTRPGRRPPGVSERAVAVLNDTDRDRGRGDGDRAGAPGAGGPGGPLQGGPAGLRVSDVADALRTGVAGTQAAFYRERGDEYPIVVRLRSRTGPAPATSTTCRSAPPPG